MKLAIAIIAASALFATASFALPTGQDYTQSASSHTVPSAAAGIATQTPGTPFTRIAAGSGTATPTCKDGYVYSTTQKKCVKKRKGKAKGSH